jgi:hypothetical protein
MNRLGWPWLALAALLTFGCDAGAQPLAINPSAAASDVRNPSSTNPAAAASDIRNPSATNPAAAASQIPQPSALAPRRPLNVMPLTGRQRVVLPARRARAIQRTRRGRVAARQVEQQRERPSKSRRRASPDDATAIMGSVCRGC